MTQTHAKSWVGVMVVVAGLGVMATLPGGSCADRRRAAREGQASDVAWRGNWGPFGTEHANSEGTRATRGRDAVAPAVEGGVHADLLRSRGAHSGRTHAGARASD